MKPIREVIEYAENQIDIYRNPDLDEFRDRIDEILKAGDKGYISNDEITDIYQSERGLIIRIRYYVRSCEQTSDFFIPNEVLDSDDPIKAMKIWSLEKEFLEWQQKYQDARQTLERTKRKVSEIKQKLEEAKK